MVNQQNILSKFYANMQVDTIYFDSGKVLDSVIHTLLLFRKQSSNDGDI